ncbi:phosphotransferase [Embleya sp. AB8]|uniref:phosphotransferase n=1 Tax=Embleya sp. AB8 TaxID=3156304 RepID=UPI003C70C262
MTNPSVGGFEHDEITDVLTRACAAIGLDATRAEVLRGHTNAVFRLGEVVVKVARRGSRVDAAQRTAAFAHWLMKQGFPTAALHGEFRQPLIFDDHAVTYWEYLKQPAEPVPAELLAAPLRLLHRLPPPPMRLPRLDALSAIRYSIDRTTLLAPDDLALLRRHVDDLESRWEGVRFKLPETVLHGDAQHRNALWDGPRALLCDWDSAVWGPAEWDLVTVEIHCRRFGYGLDHYRRFADAYGRDVTAWEDYPVLRDLRELRMITTNARKAPTAAALGEVRRRIEALRVGATDLVWQIL